MKNRLPRLTSTWIARLSLLASMVGLPASPAAGQAPGTVVGVTRLSAETSQLAGPLSNLDRFGDGVSPAGDLDGDGVMDLLVSAPGAPRGASAGRLYTIFLNADHSVKSVATTDGQSSLSVFFASGLAPLGDRNSDGTLDVMAFGVDNTVANASSAYRGARILSVDTSGIFSESAFITSGSNGFDGVISSDDVFGSSPEPVGDIDGDGITDYAVGALRDNDGGPNRGAIWVLFMSADGTVRDQSKISSTSGNLAGR